MSLLHRTHHDSADLPELTPAQLAELDALDAALAGEEIADDGLAALVREVRAAAPELGTDGAQALNDRLGASLDPAGRHARRRLPRLLHGPGAAAASLFVVVALGGGAFVLAGGGSQSDTVLSEGLSSAGDDRASSASSDSAASEAAPEEFSRNAAPAPKGRPELATSSSGSDPDEQYATSGGSSATASVNPQARQITSGELLSRASGRAVERTVDLSVRVKSGKLQDASSKVSQITRDAGGYVASSDLSLGTAGAGRASFSLRVESSRLDRAVDRLSVLGTVTSQNESSQDITSALDSAKQRLSDARKARDSLLRALAKATDASEIASLRRQIDSNRRTLASLDAQVQRVQRRADLTTIALTIEAPANGDPADDDGSWTLGDAAGDAWSALGTILGGLLVAAAVIAPFALLSATGYAIWRRRRRAARERTLDA